ncbi:MAG: Mor transcription activator family protein [Candidatus Dactylopiibacterium sp.]|nr:Mor transcription activator family protein [Candidatus Dactylopiibacterium sp.]
MNRKTALQADAEITLMGLLTTALREEAGFSEQDACRLAQNVLMRASEQRGGTYLYIGAVAPAREQIRNRVRSEFTGHNHNELAARYGLHRTTVYRYLK